MTPHHDQVPDLIADTVIRDAEYASKRSVHFRYDTTHEGTSNTPTVPSEALDGAAIARKPASEATP